jgi:hypothetical protein
LPAPNFTFFEALILIFFLRLRIDPDPGLSLDDLESAKANELDGFAFFKTDFDPFDDCIDRSLGECLAGLFAESLLHGLDQVCFVHLVVGSIDWVCWEYFSALTSLWGPAAPSASARRVLPSSPWIVNSFFPL